MKHLSFLLSSNWIFFIFYQKEYLGVCSVFQVGKPHLSYRQIIALKSSAKSLIYSVEKEGKERENKIWGIRFFTINCVLQHIPPLNTEQSAQGEKCWKIRFSGCCWIKGEMHNRWEGLAPSPLFVGHIPAEQISNTQPKEKEVLECLQVLSETWQLHIQCTCQNKGVWILTYHWWFVSISKWACKKSLHYILLILIRIRAEMLRQWTRWKNEQ